jgi:hypothetical protein
MLKIIKNIMKEDFMHYVWRFKLLDTNNLITTAGEKIEIITFGSYLQIAGPDFFNAQIKIDNQLWAGNIEMHVKSSDWYLHNHQSDKNYDNVILHVVWEHDIDVFYPSNKKIPVLILKNYVAPGLVSNYLNIIDNKNGIPCQNQISDVPSHVWAFFKERLFIERLESKAMYIENYLHSFQNNWEYVTFIAICKGFGLKTNATIFEQMALKIPFSMYLKIKSSRIQLEALFFGLLNLIPNEPINEYEVQLQTEFDFLCNKFKLEPITVTPSFYKHRPDNFPTIRLAQLASVLARTSNIFDEILNAKSVTNFYILFDVTASDYWTNHYVFQAATTKRVKKISKSFIQLLIINTIIPILYAYNKSVGNENIDNLIHLINFLPPEKNNAINFFDKLQVPVNSAFDSQALLQLKNNYCDKLQCLHCAVGKYIIK